MKYNPLKPSERLLGKIASVVSKADKLIFNPWTSDDVAALESALEDPEVKSWIEDVRKLGLLPKRS